MAIGPCIVGGPAVCAATNAVAGATVGQAAGAATGSILETLQTEFTKAITAWIAQLFSFWMKVPSANPLTTSYDSGVPSNPQLVPALTMIRDSLSTVTIALGVLGIFMVVIRSVMRNSAQDLLGIVKLLANVIGVSLFGVTVVWIGIQASDAYAPWILTRVQQQIGSTDMAGTLFPAAALAEVGFATTGIVMIVVVLGSLAQTVAMLFRGALLLVFLAIWPTVAASTATESGRNAFKKMNSWIVALILFKPVAATIYALGLLLVADNQAATGTDSLMNIIYGCMILLLGALALPALVKFIAPPAGIGASNLFSGGAALAAIATGAIAVATMGAGTAAGAAAGAGAGAGAAGAGAGAGSAGGAAASASGEGTQAGLSTSQGEAGHGQTSGDGSGGTTGAPTSTVGAEQSTATPGGAQESGESAPAPAGGSLPSGGTAAGDSAPAGGSAPSGGTPNGGSAPAGGTSQGGSAPSGGTPNGGSAPAGGTSQGGSAPSGGTPNGGSAPAGGSAPSGGGSQLPPARPIIRGPKYTRIDPPVRDDGPLSNNEGE